MIEPDGVLDGDHGETVAVWFGVGHGQSDYPDPIKATQPCGELERHRESMARFGQGPKAVEAVSRPLAEFD